MDVIADRAQIAVAAAIHDQGFVAAAEQMAEEFVPAVETARVNAQQPFHARDQIGLWRFKHQMKMISHQAPGMNLPAGFGAGFAQRGEELLPVVIVAEDRLAMITPIHHVIDCARIF